MPIELKMPTLSPTMEEGTLAKWLVKEGDKVESGDILAEIETDKATMEFEAVDEGTISKILIPEGTDGVKVGTVIALMGGDGAEASTALVRQQGFTAQDRGLGLFSGTFGLGRRIDRHLDSLALGSYFPV